MLRASPSHSVTAPAACRSACRPVVRGNVAAAAASKRDGAALSGPATAALIAATAAVQLQAAPAYAADVDTAIGAVVDTVQASGQVLKAGLDIATKGASAVKQGIDIAAPIVKDGYEKAAPVIKQGAEIAVKVAGEAFKAGAPVVQSGLQEASSYLQSSGVDVDAVSSAAGAAGEATTQVVSAATPTLAKVLNFLASSEPITLATYGAGAVAAYYLFPTFLGKVGDSMRGYAGELTPAAALNVAERDFGAYIVDIRSQKEKEQAGSPDVPQQTRNRVLEVEFAEVDRKVRQQLKSAEEVEAKMTAVQIASLKRVNKNTTLLLLDSKGMQSPAVAKQLAVKGYNKAFVITGGFEGRGGWMQSKLQIRSYYQARPSGGFGTFIPLARTMSMRGDARPAPTKKKATA